MFSCDAEVKRLQLMAHLVTARDVIEWADRVIAESSSPPNELLIELSLAGGQDEHAVLELIERMAYGCDAYAPARLVVRQMYDAVRKGRSLARTFARGLYQVANDYRHKLPQDLAFMSGIDDDWINAKQDDLRCEDELINSFVDELKKSCEPGVGADSR